MYRSYFKRLDPQVHYPRAGTQPIAFDMPALCRARNDLTGLGSRPVRIAIGELGGGFDPDNYKTAMAAWGLPEPTVTVVRGQNQPGLSDADGEVELDIQVAAARAAYGTGRGAEIGMFFGGNTNAEFLACQNAMTAWGADTQSWSWGGPEASWSAAAMRQFAAAHSQSACPIFAAAGDNDSGDGLSGANVDFPGSSPYVICCGGTYYIVGQPEQVWNDGKSEGTGGGYSNPQIGGFPPQAYQLGIPANATGRMVPDLADVASPRTGYNIYIKAAGGWGVIGGTSAVAPSMAGLFGAYAVELEKRGLPPLGNSAALLARLYRHPAAFWDVTVGSNGRWRARTGVDECSGIGVPNGAELFNQLIGSIPGPPVVVPAPVVTPPVVVPPVVPPAPAGSYVLVNIPAGTTIQIPGGVVVPH